ncbi:MAG: polysaccharide deacetylase family protein [Hyphomicrobium sp.]|jgi:peptidoglycan/xylan/chitin deacetylase (PgdA/CDA1 family)|uniref:polysaccharide deacetylase family protein n=1 Tax=Hyphomicrobium sp. TaxID=82 RepID=UPI0025C624E9|nr:polysaccharide deacetylase family protein [Hyphomicrobium sp.]MBX9862518.1 polysaccharide deacetylase family protein [Hyphomicrobium sp.]
MRQTLSALLVMFASATAHAADTPKAAPPPAKPAAAAAATETSALPTPPKSTCSNPDALGVARTVEIDTKGGPGFGFEHYKAYDFLQEKEVVLTFDDGPQVRTTKAILDALDAQCTKAIFFSLGKMALGLPEIIRDVAHRGHTVGTHTWSHQDMRKKSDQEAKDEIEKGVSGVRRAVGGPISPFFRYPYLRDSATTLAYLQSRNIAMFSTDVDSFDFKRQTADQLVKSTMARLDKKGKGVLLMHDIQPHTAAAMPALLAALKTGGYKVVHMKAKDELKTLAEYDAMIEKDVKGLPSAGSERPLSSVVRTVPSP